MGSCFKFGFRKKNRYDFHNPYSQPSPHGTFRSSVHGPVYNDNETNGNVVMSVENKNAINGHHEELDYQRRNSLDRAEVIHDIKDNDAHVEIKTEDDDREERRSLSAKSDHSDHEVPVVAAHETVVTEEIVDRRSESDHEKEPESDHEKEPESDHEKEPELEPVVVAVEEVHLEPEPVVDRPPSPSPPPTNDEGEFTYQTVQLSDGGQYSSSVNYRDDDVPDVQVSTIHVGDTESEGEDERKDEPVYARVNKTSREDVQTESQVLGEESVSTKSQEEDDNEVNEKDEHKTTIAVNMGDEDHHSDSYHDDNLSHDHTPIEMVY